MKKGGGVKCLCSDNSFHSHIKIQVSQLVWHRYAGCSKNLKVWWRMMRGFGKVQKKRIVLKIDGLLSDGVMFS